jgi:tRNA A-37 threonylcarbamoyl transferase component Bud32
MKIRENINFSIKDTVLDIGPVELLSRIESAIRFPEKVIKSERRKSTLRVNIPPWGDLCLQIYKRDLKRTVLSPFRLSKREKIWNFSGSLLKNAILVPEPVLFLEIKKYIFTIQTYIAYRWIDGGINLGTLALNSEIFHNNDFKSILCRCVDMVEKIHNSGFVHGDLKWSNFLYIDGENPKVILMDTDSLKRSSSLNLQGKDFARFILSAIEYQLNPELKELLICRYIKGRGPTNAQIEKSIRKRIAKKIKKYQGRAPQTSK